jgi:hypothetical protein
MSISSSPRREQATRPSTARRQSDRDLKIVHIFRVPIVMSPTLCRELGGTQDVKKHPPPIQARVCCARVDRNQQTGHSCLGDGFLAAPAMFVSLDTPTLLDGVGRRLCRTSGHSLGA